MFFTDFFNKDITVNGIKKGVCIGIGISLKTLTIKYLLCSLSPSQTLKPKTDFAVNISSLLTITNEDIRLSKLRTALPTACVKIFYRLPCYFEDGVYIDNLEDIRFENNVAVQLYTVGGLTIPANSLLACADAVILRKKQAFPLGQPIPKTFFDSLKSTSIVTKRLLKEVIKQGELIKLTLALSPFNIY